MHASVAYIQVTTEKHAATPHPTTPLNARPSGLCYEVSKHVCMPQLWILILELILRLNYIIPML